MPDGLQSFQGHVNILEVLRHCNLLALVVSCLYFPKDLLLVLSEIYSSRDDNFCPTREYQTRLDPNGLGFTRPDKE